MKLAQLVDVYLHGSPEIFWPGAHEHYRKPGRNGKPGRETGEAHNMDHALRTIALAGLSDMDADLIRPVHIRQMQKALINKGSVSREVINARIGKVKLFIKWAVGRELCSASYEALYAVEKLEIGRTTAPEGDGIQSVPWSTVKASLAALRADLRRMVLVQWHTGMRPGELVIMRRCDISPHPEKPHIWLYRPCEFKSRHRKNATRVIVLNMAAQAEIRQQVSHLALQLSLFEQADGDLAGDQAFRNLWPYSKPYTYRNGIQRALEDAGLPRWCPMQIRHTVATEMTRASGGNLEPAKQQLGHTTTATTRGYVDRGLDRGDLDEAIKYIERSEAAAVSAAS